MFNGYLGEDEGPIAKLTIDVQDLGDENENTGWQQEYMADYYIEYIAKGLKELHPELSSKAFIDYKDGTDVLDKTWNWDEFFIAMAWQGLQETIELRLMILN